MNTLLNIGKSALLSQQTAINVVGNNIANVDTVGYSRQIAVFETNISITAHGGQIGTGVDIKEIERQFNRFVEDAYLERFSPHSRWSEQSLIMSSVESTFNESDRHGISAAMSDFFNSWQDLADRPSDSASKEHLLSNATMLASLIRDARNTLTETQAEMDVYIEQGVREVNEILETIADINMKIAETDIPGESNANQLLDQRDLEVRKLAAYIDIEVYDKGSGDMRITTSAGHTLLEKGHVYSLETAAGRVENALMPDSAYEGTIEFEGTDAYEYVLEVVKPYDYASGTNATMRVSLDGGKTWMRNEDGTEYHVEIPDNTTDPVKVKDLNITFTADTAKLGAGDRFEVIPKTMLIWNTPTSDPMNITPQAFNDGTENVDRVTGGKLAAYFAVRDQHVGEYIDQLDELSANLIWEVNKAHSQGASTEGLTHILGTVELERADLPLANSASGLGYYDRLEVGNLGFQIYDKNGNPVEGAPVALDFNIDPLGLDPDAEGIQMFDPEIHSYDDVEAAINATYAGYLRADMVDGKLQLTAIGDHNFVVREDSTGLLASFGVNTFFQGDNAEEISVKEGLSENLAFINSGSVNNNGLVTDGDGGTASFIASLVHAEITFDTGWESSTSTFASFYGKIVGGVGADTRTALYNNDYNTALAKDLGDQVNSYSGVNLDEEMASLIRFQHSYTAAAKLITTADQMMQVLLGLKQ